MHEGDDRAEDPRAGEHPPESAEEAAWREIVANYGDPVLDDDPVTDDTVIASYTGSLAFDPDAWENEAADGADADEDLVPESEQFVAPRPSLPRTSPERFMAWLGVLGSPVAAVLLVTLHTVTGFVVPDWGIAFLVLAFLGGFGYLLVTMSREPPDPWDDGARL